MCALHVPVCQEYIFSLAIGRIRGHRAAAAPPLLGCSVWRDMFSSNAKYRTAYPFQTAY